MSQKIITNIVDVAGGWVWPDHQDEIRWKDYVEVKVVYSSSNTDYVALIGTHEDLLDFISEFFSDESYKFEDFFSHSITI